MLNNISFSSIEKQYSTTIGYTYSILSHLFTVLGHFYTQRASVGFKAYQILYLAGMQFATYNFLIISHKKMDWCSKNPVATKTLIIRGIIGLMGGLCFFFGLVLVPLSEGVVVQMTTPVITGILAKFLLGEKYDMTLFLATIFSFSGVLLICKPDFIFGSGLEDKVYELKNLGIFLVLLGAAAGAAAQIVIKKLGNLSDAYTMTFYLGMGSAIGGSVGQIIQGLKEIHWEAYIWIGLVGLLRSCSHLFMNKSYKFGEASKISLMFYSQVPLAFLIDLFIVGITPDVYSIIGSVIVFSSVFLMLYKNWKQNQRTQK